MPTWAIAFLAVLTFPGIGAAQAPGGPAEPLPEAIPLFPLPDVTLLPNTTQPFHIFETRYRAMVADALATDSIIGMVALRPGYESEYEGRPEVYEMGCAGVIVSANELPDGRYAITVRGLVKFRILQEDQSRSYRLADVEELVEAAASDRALLEQRRRQLEEAVRSAYPGAPLPPATASHEEAVDGLSLLLPLDPAQRQELLEADGPAERASMLIRLLGAEVRASA